MDEDTPDHEKTQIYLPGKTPLPPRAAGKEHEVLLKPASAAKTAGDASKVDFDITGARPDAVDFDITGAAGAPAAGSKPRPAATPRPVPAPAAKSNTRLIVGVIVVVVLAAVGFLLTR